MKYNFLMRMQDIFERIYQHFLLTDFDINRIRNSHEKIFIKKGEYLIKEGKIANQYYLLEKGLIRAFVHDFNNNEITTEIFCNHEIVIIPYSLFQRLPSKENLQAITDCILWEINYDKFQKLFHEIVGVREWGRSWLAYQIFELKERSLEMITVSATDRYLKLLKEKPQIIKHVPLKQIATYLGVTDTSLSRIRKKILK